jgi:hypothetical protein
MGCTCVYDASYRGREVSASFEEHVQHDAHELMVSVAGALDDVSRVVGDQGRGALQLGGEVRITTQCRECEAEHHRHGHPHSSHSPRFSPAFFFYRPFGVT